MSNLDWIRTLSGEELATWFYEVWLGNMAHQYTDSKLGLVSWLNATRTEPQFRIEPPKDLADLVHVVEYADTVDCFGIDGGTK